MMRQRYSADDADAGAGTPLLNTIETAPSSTNTINSANTDLDFFEDKITEPVLVLGVDITHWNDQQQFLYCASGVFGFSLCYGYLQELLSVTLCSRKLGLFLAMMQFLGYTILAYCMRIWVYHKHQHQSHKMTPSRKVPLAMYLGLSLLRAIDLAMTNLAMQYINYPAKTLMKSSRVVFTMLFGVLVQGKVYKLRDYGIVFLMVLGLGSFLHADSQSSAVFEIRGVIMLTVSLLCDGMISNVSETILRQYGVGQDEFIFRLYSISLLCIIVAAIANGDFHKGFIWSFHSGTYDEYLKMTDATYTGEVVTPSYSAAMKIVILVLFSSMGFFGSSCSAAITKNFGALTMSITSTARKATTLFLSFCLFRENVCTMEHVFGMVIFIAALAAKSMKRNKKMKKKFSSVMIPMASPTTASAADNTKAHAMVHVV